MAYIAGAKGDHINNCITAQIRADILAIAIMIVHMIAAQNHVIASHKHRLDWLGQIRCERQKDFAFAIERFHLIIGCNENFVG